MLKIKFKRQKIIKRLVSVALMVGIISSCIPLSVFAADVEYDMSYGSGSGGGVAGSTSGFQLLQVKDGVDAMCCGYRFSTVNTKTGDTQNNVIDVYTTAQNNGNNGEIPQGMYKLFKKGSNKKLNKAQWNSTGIKDSKGYYCRFSNSTAHSYRDKSYSSNYINLTLPTDPSAIKSWVTDERWGNKRKTVVLEKIGHSQNGYVLADDCLKDNDLTLLVEPIYCLQLKKDKNSNPVKAVMTVTDIAMYGCYMFGHNSGTTTENSGGSSWGWIARYTNNNWARALFTKNRVSFTNAEYGWGAGSKADDDYDLLTFQEMLEYGYGVGIIAGTMPSTETKPTPEKDDKNVYISAWNTFLGSFSQNSDGVWQFKATKPIKSVRCKKDVSYENGDAFDYSSYKKYDISNSAYPAVVISNNGKVDVPFANINIKLQMYYDTGTKGSTRTFKNFSYPLNKTAENESGTSKAVFTKYKIDYADRYSRGETYDTFYSGNTLKAGDTIVVCLNQ